MTRCDKRGADAVGNVFSKTTQVVMDGQEDKIFGVEYAWVSSNVEMRCGGEEDDLLCMHDPKGHHRKPADMGRGKASGEPANIWFQDIKD